MLGFTERALLRLSCVALVCDSVPIESTVIRGIAGLVSLKTCQKEMVCSSLLCACVNLARKLVRLLACPVDRLAS